MGSPGLVARRLQDPRLQFVADLQDRLRAGLPEGPAAPRVKIDAVKLDGRHVDILEKETRATAKSAARKHARAKKQYKALWKWPGSTRSSSRARVRSMDAR